MSTPTPLPVLAERTEPAVIRVAILGSTGSIGTSALNVIERHPDKFRVVALAANSSIDELRRQAARHEPHHVVLADASEATGGEPGGTWRYGREALIDLAGECNADVVVNALVGAAGLEPTLAVLRSGKRLALANKESLVAGGPMVLKAAKEGGGELIPIDSEHSAILQCIEGSGADRVSRIVLTASGGPFRGRRAADMSDILPSEALRHPTWAMGSKITIDSATLANKALEVIEAHFLYRMEYDRIEVVVHPQSVIHSLVEFLDGSVLAQMGFPTMELPILYALSYPARIDDGELRTFDPLESTPLTFEDVDHGSFPMFGIGVAAGRAGGRAPAVFNAANEVAVQAFLRREVRFSDMADIVEAALQRVPNGSVDSVEDVLIVDAEARQEAWNAVAALG